MTAVWSVIAEPNNYHVHHHRWTDGRGHHAGPHPHHYLIHGGNPQILLWGLLVHPSPLHHLLHRPGLPRLRVRVRTCVVPVPRFAEKFLAQCFVFFPTDGSCEGKHPQAWRMSHLQFVPTSLKTGACPAPTALCQCSLETHQWWAAIFSCWHRWLFKVFTGFCLVKG